MLKSSLSNVIESLGLVRNLSNSVSRRVDQLSTDLTDATFEIQNNVTGAIQALESSFSDDITANKNQINLLSASMQVRGKVDTSARMLLYNLVFECY